MKVYVIGSSYHSHFTILRKYFNNMNKHEKDGDIRGIGGGHVTSLYMLYKHYT